MLTCSRPAWALVKGAKARVNESVLSFEPLIGKIEENYGERTLLYVGGGTSALRSSRRRIPALSY